MIALGELGEAISAARLMLDPAGERVALALYRLLAEGEPVPTATLAKRVDQRPDSVERTLEGWPGVFCHFIHFFSSEQEAAPWIERHPGTFVLTVEQAFELGQITNRRQFPIALH